MNREILYRAKRTGTGEWIEGYYSEIKLTSTPYILNGEIAIEPCKKGIVQFECYEVWPDTVCQYTGLTDKNGRKIFEGDILKSELGKVGKISFNESHMAFMILEKTENRYYHVEECSGNHMEIIGNIFDNMELLRGA